METAADFAAACFRIRLSPSQAADLALCIPDATEVVLAAASQEPVPLLPAEQALALNLT
jgi:hypothetical protein